MEKQISVKDAVNAKKGSPEAFTRLYESSHDRIHFLCLKLLGNEDDAADAVQDTFITAYNKLSGLADAKAFPAWLSRIAANVCKDYLKKNKPVLTSDDSDANTILDAVEESGEDFIPHAYLDQSETRNMIMEIIDTKLSAEQKAVILLHYYNELSVADIAAALAVSDGTVKSRLNSARKLIKLAVEDHEKKGVKLYTMAFVEVPVLTLLLRKVAEEHPMDEAKAAEILQNVMKTVGIGTGAAAAGGLKAVIAKAGYAFKVASVAQKAIAVTVAVAIVGGGTATITLAVPAIQAAQLSAELTDESGALYSSIQILNREFGNSRLASKDVAHSLSLAAVIEQSARKELEKPDAYRSKVASSWKLLSAIDLGKSGLNKVNGKTSNDAVDVTFPRLIAAVKALCANAGVSTWTPADGLTVSTNAVNLTEGDSSAVTASVTPDAASDKSVSWVSDNPGVATVDASGKITAVAAGNATVTASASPVVASAPVSVVAGGSASASSSATRSAVSSAASSSSSVSSSASSSAPDTASTLSSSGYVLSHGESYPAVLTPTLGSVALSWHSSDTSVVTVDSASGKITAVGVGTATVYATVSTAPSASVKTSVAAKPAPAPAPAPSSTGNASKKVSVSVAPKPAPAPSDNSGSTQKSSGSTTHSSGSTGTTHSSTNNNAGTTQKSGTSTNRSTGTTNHSTGGSTNTGGSTHTGGSTGGSTDNGGSTGGSTGGGMGIPAQGGGNGDPNAPYYISGGVGGGASN